MSSRKVVFSGEAWAPLNDEEEAELVFSHCNYIWEEDGEFYFANIRERLDESAFPHNLKGKHIPKEQVYARVDSTLTIAPEPLPKDSYVKTPSFAYTDEDAAKKTCMGDALLAEAKIYELLKNRPHPNIATYYGCLTQSEFLTGLVLRRYKKSLADLVREGHHLPDAQVTHLMDTTRKADIHLHLLGLAHNDLNPANIMLDEEGNPFLIDLDSCAPFGQELLKYGTPGWTSKENWRISSKNNDEHALKCIDLYLRGEYNPADHIE